MEGTLCGVLGIPPPTIESLLLGAAGPPRFSERLAEIDRLTARHERRLVAVGDELCARFGSGDLLAAAQRRAARAWSFDEVNRLIDDHNRWYPIERRLPIDPATGEYLPVLGRSYRRPRLDAAWALRRLAD